jgi:hypothetical protein
MKISVNAFNTNVDEYLKQKNNGKIADIKGMLVRTNNTLNQFKNCFY